MGTHFSTGLVRVTWKSSFPLTFFKRNDNGRSKTQSRTISFFLHIPRPEMLTPLSERALCWTGGGRTWPGRSPFNPCRSGLRPDSQTQELWKTTSASWLLWGYNPSALTCVYDPSNFLVPAYISRFPSGHSPVFCSLHTYS